MKTPAINISQKSEEYNMVLLSQLYHPAELSQTIQQQGETKPRRRRRRNGKGGETRLLGAKKRKLTDEQVTMLELNFGNEHKLETERKDKLALELGLHPRQVAIWFQNRRARYKNKQLEEEYVILKKEHERVVLQKCALESEVLRLNEKLGEAETEKQWMVIQQQLAEADKEIKKLNEGCGENSHNIGSPQMTIKTEDTAVNDVTDTPFLDPYTPQAPFDLTGEDDHDHDHHHHHQEPTPSLEIEEQHRQDGSDMTDERGGDVVISYWAGHYGDIMFDNGSLWDDGYFQ